MNFYTEFLGFTVSVSWGAPNGELCPECEEIGDEEVADGDVEYENGVWEKCPACKGLLRNELGQACAWCADSGNPGYIRHGHGAEDE